MRIPEPSGTGKSKRKGGRGNSLPEPESGGDFDPFLKAEDVGKLGSKAKITVLGPPIETESEFSDMTLPIKYKTQQYAMGLKTSGANYRILYKRFGKSPKKWKGIVNIEIKHFKKNDYVAVI